MLASERPLQAVEHDSEPLQVEVIHSQEPDLAGSKSVPVGHQKNSLVSFVSDAGEEPPRFVEREKLNGFSATGASLLMARRCRNGCFLFATLRGFLFGSSGWHVARLAYRSISQHISSD